MEQPRAKLWIKIDLPGLGQVGPGKIQLLKAVEETHSISAAARALGMSYRKAWGLIAELNRLLGRPVVDTRSGGRDHGGAALTKEGRDIVLLYDDILKKAQSATAQETKSLDERFFAKR